MCFSSLQERQLHNEKWEKNKKRDVDTVCDVWRWASVGVNLGFCCLAHVSSVFFLSPPPSILSSFGVAEVTSVEVT